jgi:hypothetical protein
MESEYQENVVHLIRHLEKKDVVWCRKSFIFAHMKVTEKEEECTCSTCRSKLNSERLRIEKLKE